MEEKQINEGKAVAWLSYLGILVIIPLIMQKENPFTKFHIKQGIVLLIADIAWSILQMGLFFIPFLGPLLVWLVWVFLVVLAIMGIVNSLSGKTEPLFLLGKYAAKLNF